MSVRCPDPCCPTRRRSPPTARSIIGGLPGRRAGRRVRHAAVRLRRGPPARPLPRGGRRVRRRRAVYATKAFLCRAMARLAHEEGMLLDVASGGELHVALAAGVPADRRARCTATTRASTSCARRSTAGVRHIVVDSFDELDRLDALPRRRRVPVPDVLLRVTPGVARPHPRVHRHRPGRLEVRLQPRQRRRRRGPSSGPRRSPSVDLVGLHCHIGIQRVRRRQLRPGGRGDGRLRRAARPARARRSAAGSASPTSRARRRRRSPSGPSVGARRLRGAGVRSARQRRAGPGDRRRRRRHRCTRSARSRTIPGVRTYVAVDGGMSDNPRPVLYGSGYEAFLPRAARRRAPAAGRASSASTASPATCWCSTPALPDRPRRRRPAGHAGHRRLRPLDGLQLQQGAPPAGRVRRDGAGPARRAPRDLRRPAGHRRRLRP